MKKKMMMMMMMMTVVVERCYHPQEKREKMQGGVEGKNRRGEKEKRERQEVNRARVTRNAGSKARAGREKKTRG